MRTTMKVLVSKGGKGENSSHTLKVEFLANANTSDALFHIIGDNWEMIYLSIS